MNKKDQRRFAQMFSVGIIANWTVLPPVHELGHILAAFMSGGSGSFLGWGSSWIAPRTVFTIAAGPLWEMAIYAAVIYMSHLYGKGWGWIGFFWGNLFSAWFITIFAPDMQMIAVRVGLSVFSTSVIWLVITAPIGMILVRKIGDFNDNPGARENWTGKRQARRGL